MDSGLSLLLIICCSLLPFLHASDQSSDAARNATIIFEPSQTVIGIAQRNNLLAFFVVDRSSGSVPPGLIAIYGDGKAGAMKSLLQIPTKAMAGSRLLEFQFGDESSLFFCTSVECG